MSDTNYGFDYGVNPRKAQADAMSDTARDAAWAVKALEEGRRPESSPADVYQHVEETQALAGNVLEMLRDKYGDEIKRGA